MGEIVNLKRHRKRKDRAAKEEIAAENRVQFGRTKAEKELAEAQNEKSTTITRKHFPLWPV